MIATLVAHAMCAVMPATAAMPGLTRADAKKFTRTARRECDNLYFAGLVLGAFVFVVTPVLTVSLPLPSFALSSKSLDRHAQRIVAHRSYWIRQAVFLVRLNAGMAWGALPQSRAFMNLAPYPDDPGTFVGDGNLQQRNRL